MISHILVIWTMVAVQGVYGDIPKYDWRPIGTFSSAPACTQAARQLNVHPDRFRCLPTQVKEVK